MKKSYLLLTALAVAPLCGAQNLEVVPMPADTAAAVGLNAQASDISAALALLPQNTEGYMAVGNMPGFLRLAGMGSEELGEAALVESAAIGFGAGAADMLRQALPLYSGMATEASLTEMAQAWAMKAHEHAQGVIEAQLKQQSAEAIDKAIDAIAAWKTAPLYAVVSVHEEGREMLPALQQSLLEELSEDEHAESVESGVWKGVRLRCSDDISEIVVEDEELSALQKVKLEGALRQLSLHIMATVRDNALVVAVCADPAQLSLADTPAASVLASDKAAVLKEQSNPLTAIYLSAEMNNACRELNMQPAKTFSGFATGVFKTLGSEGTPAAQACQGAVTALSALMAQYEQCTPAVDAPTTLLMWEDGDLHLDMVSDANGARFAAAESVSLPSSDKTFFTFTSDPVTGTHTCDGSSMLNACETLVNGLSATLTEEGSAQVQGAMAQYHLFDSEKETLGNAFAAWKSAFSGSFSFVADAAGSVPASLLGGSPAETVMVPRVAVNLGVAQRADIEKGRSLFMQAVKQGMAKVGADESVLDSVPMAETKADNASLYSLALPICCPGFSPTVAVTDKTWSFSSSVDLATAVAKSPVAPAAAEGKATFCFSPAPVAELLKTAAALDAENEDLAEAAAAADAVSSVISSVSGTATTTADDLFRLHVDVTLKH